MKDIFSKIEYSINFIKEEVEKVDGSSEIKKKYQKIVIFLAILFQIAMA